ncbi:MAG: hypothetical protein WBD31_13830 [Rubripirellula sp.]
MMRLLAWLATAYLTVGLVTATIFASLIGSTDFEMFASIILLWPMYWMLMVIFAAAAAGAP